MAEIYHYGPFVVERGKVNELKRALMLNDLIQENAVPSTFFTVIDYTNERGFYKMLQHFGITGKVLHGEQSYEIYETVHIGDQIQGRVQLLDVVSKKNNSFYYIETEYVNQREELVARARATLVQIAGDVL